MPVYEFICEKCGERFDKLFRSVSGEPKAACPKCESKKTTRSLSLVNTGESKGESGGMPEMPMCGRCGEAGPCGMN
jgi:putative FmdB family regulatory protein